MNEVSLKKIFRAKLLVLSPLVAFGVFRRQDCFVQ